MPETPTAGCCRPCARQKRGPVCGQSGPATAMFTASLITCLRARDPCPELASARSQKCAVLPPGGWLEGGGGSRVFGCPYPATVFVVAVKTRYDNHEHHSRAREARNDHPGHPAGDQRPARL